MSHGPKPKTNQVTDGELMRAFETKTLRRGEFGHEDHVRLAWLYVTRRPFPRAVEEFTTGLKEMTAALRAPERYHETITWAYLVLTHERARRLNPGHSWEEFAEANPDLLERGLSVLTAYYEAETLASDFARQVFVFPDRTTRGRRVTSGLP